MDDELGPIELGGFPLSVYGAMFGATVAGQFGGFGLGDLAGHRMMWVPIACSVLFEALAGWFFASRAHPRGALAAMDWGRLSGIYSMGLAAVTVPLVVWTAASDTPTSPFGGHDPSGMVLLGLAALAGLTVVRWAIMLALATRSSRLAAGGPRRAG